MINAPQLIALGHETVGILFLSGADQRLERRLAGRKVKRP